MDSEKIIMQPCKSGYLGRIQAKQPFSRKRVAFAPYGTKYEAIFRLNACFTRAYVTDDIKKIPEETQNLLVFENGLYTLYYFVAYGDCRCSFSGGNEPSLIFETGDDNVKVSEAVAFFKLSGTDLYKLFEEAAEILSNTFCGVKRLCEKKRPSFLDKIGFCTYNAFYSDVSEKNVSLLLNHFADNGQKLGYVILDAGWQCTDKDYMSGFAADSIKFSGGLKQFKQNMMRRYGISDILVWHTFMGYWCGVSPDKYESYGIVEDTFDYDECYVSGTKNCKNGALMNTAGENFYPPNIRGQKVFFPENVQKWYNDFYAYLSQNGVSGSKIDAIGWIEVVNRHNGGRVRGTKKIVQAAEDASNEYFGANSIYCSCNTNDFFFVSEKCSLVRTSSDYEPENVNSHGEHVFSNAHAALWFGEFFYCDFDMFQSGRSCGKFHAISRAVSGGPVYCTDNLQSIDYGIIKSLCREDGSVPRLKSYAKLTQDCVFKKPQEGFIKIYNIGENGYMLGVFNCVNQSVEEKIDVEFLPKGKLYAAYSYNNGFIGWLKNGESFRLGINGIDADVISFIPEQSGFAVIGEKGKLLPAEFVSVESFRDGIEISCFENCEVMIAVKNQNIFLNGIRLRCGITNIQSNKNNKTKLEVREYEKSISDMQCAHRSGLAME